ncbi:hypothetical protein KPA07_06160 [Corynebacterium aurimucosum]|uniref:hypothetical protein n=1 Tax=Corynebacterium aurimucosum TaxID=169292 RepID=UPI001C0F1442|nr:hypothetical protein [Corynebacterium aurimucosum]MBU5654495.1 hypothetical protein [Corynebacterium aurimucosum]
MTNPTRQQIINAHEALIELCRLVEELAVTEVQARQAWKRHASIRAALPPKPQPTMADMEWDDDEHYLAEAEHANDYTVMMLKPMRLEPRIKCLAFHFGDFCIVYSDPKDLTPTGRRYTLTEVQDD